jgi:hypothetical protein
MSRRPDGGDGRAAAPGRPFAGWTYQDLGDRWLPEELSELYREA